ncbi:ASCH domain-containing protein [Modestobacter sp. DSM 44400]|uniref:ASCH domain-containing protein n=1 Tax=Modestobacter sp. DSM 44400 TaxID=1550230 RepID=UPI00352A7DFB
MLMSIRPRHVESILRGEKRVELRRTRPVIKRGQPVAIYATTPSAAVVATCKISAIETSSPSDLWATVKAICGVTKDEYDAYFADSATAVALHLTEVSALEHPVSLRHLREAGPFTPPQTWHFIDGMRLTGMLADHPAASRLQAMIS